MKKEIKIGDKTVELNSSAGWFYDYQEQFGHDIMPDLMPLLEGLLGTLAELQESGQEIALTDEIVGKIIDALATAEVTTIFNIAWAMAHNADETIESPRKWVNSFENFPVDEVVPELALLIIQSSVSSKNSASLLKKFEAAKKTASDLRPSM